MRTTLKLVNAIAAPLFFFKLLGVWHFENKFQIIYSVYGKIIYAFATFLYAFFLFMSVVKAWGNFAEMADGIYLLVTIACLTLKVGFLNPKDLKNTLKLLDSSKFTQLTEDQKNIMLNAMKIAKRNAIAILVLCSTTCFSWIGGPIISGAVKYKKLPVRAWYPIPFDISPYYEIVYVYQFFGIWVGALMNCSVDGIVAGLLAITCGQLKVLKNSLRNLRKRALIQLHRKSDNFMCNACTFNENDHWKCTNPLHLTINDDQLERETCTQMIECIQHHVAIISFVQKLEYTFNRSMFAQFSASMLVICITAFEISVVAPFSMQFFTILLYMINMIIQIFFYCWYGNEVYLTSLTINDDIFNSDWYRFGPRVKKLMYIMMERAKKPLHVTAGKMFKLSLETFTSILRSAYSFYAVLQQIDIDIDLNLVETDHNIQ